MTTAPYLFLALSLITTRARAQSACDCPANFD